MASQSGPVARGGLNVNAAAFTFAPTGSTSQPPGGPPRGERRHESRTHARTNSEDRRCAWSFGCATWPCCQSADHVCVACCLCSRTRRSNSRSSAGGDGVVDASAPEAVEDAALRVDEPGGSGAPGRRAWRRGDHLAGFMYTQPVTEAEQHGGRRLSGGRGRGRGSFSNRGSHKPSAPLSREAFVQANFRVLVLDEAARRVPGHGPRCDADRSVDWADVVSVESCSPQPPACPICLEDSPQVAQVTPCGHTFCFACIARHLLPKEALRGDVAATSTGPPALYASRGCPMCGAHVRLADLRRVTMASAGKMTEQPAVAGGTATFTLVARHKDSLVPTPVADLAPGEALPCDWPYVDSDTGGLSCWAKLTLTSEEDDAAAADLAALEHLMADAMRERGCPCDPAHVAALSAAMDAIHARVAAWAERREELRDSGVVGGRSVAGAGVASSPPVGSFGSAGSGAILARAHSGNKAHQQSSRPPMQATPDKASPPAGWRGVADAAWDGDSDGEREPAAGGGQQSQQAPSGHEGDADLVFPADDDDDDAVLTHGGRAPPTLPAPDSELPATQPAPAAALALHPSDVWLFYQACDGSCVTLHPLSVRTLLAHHGSYDRFPATLVDVPVLHVEQVTQSEASRQRLRHVAHWPMATLFSLAEVDLSSVVSKEAWASTAQERKQRAAKRAAAAAAERREKAAAKAAEEARVTAFTVARVAAAPPGPEQLVAMPRLSAPEAGDVQSEAASPSSAEARAALSFASVAGLGYASGLNSPVLGIAGAAQIGPSPVTPAARPAWGPSRGAVVGGASQSPPVTAVGWFGSQPDAAPAAAADANAPAGPSGGSGKKKGRGQLLFTTSQRRY
jgi:hypothetical protein